MRYLFIIWLLCSASISLRAEGVDSEYWQRLHWIHHEWSHWTSYFTSEARFNQHWSRFYYLRMSENLAYKVNQHLDAEVHLGFIHSKPHDQTYFTNHYRLEFELNPHITARHVTYTLRNRLEFIKQERNPRIEKVFRFRAEAYKEIEECGPLIAISCSEEIFYRFHNTRFIQSRFIPIQLFFSLCDENRVSLFLMVRNFLSGASWHKSAIVGTDFYF